MTSMYNATKVIIDGKEYTVERHMYCPSRGHEYLLSSKTQPNCRVCHAGPKYTRVFTSGEQLIFK